MAVAKFYKGSSTFNCRICQRLTRDTQGTNLRLCDECQRICETENHINDYDLTPEQLAVEQEKIAKLKAAAIAKGGVFAS